MEFPEAPTCHAGAPTTWRPKNEKLHPSHDLPTAFRTCSYCGSIHPEDLLEALRAGAKLSQADWKYGWPHKFYVEGIPNPYAGQPQRVGSMGIAGSEPTAEERARMGEDAQVVQNGYWPTDGTPRYDLVQFRPAGPTTHAKWYNEHLQELNDEAFAELARELHQRTGVLFLRDENGLKYRS